MSAQSLASAKPARPAKSPRPAARAKLAAAAGVPTPAAPVEAVAHRSAPDSSAPGAAPAPCLFVGVDLAKDSFQVCLLDERTGQRRDLNFTYDDRGIARFLALLAPQQPPRCVLVVMEATGGLQRRLAAELAAAAVPALRVAVVNPKRVRDFAKAVGALAKTDPLDAWVIARFAQAVRPADRPLPSEQQARLAALAARRRQLLAMRTQELNRLGQFDTPQFGQAPAAVGKGIKKLIALLDGQVEEVDGLIAELVEADERWAAKAAILQTAKGVGQATAHGMLAEMPELGTLNRRQVACLAGLAPFSHDSGKLKGTRCIWGGRAAARSWLYMASLSAVRFNPQLRAMYQRLKGRGKKAKVALVACMRKLLTILNTMLRNNTPWDESLAQAAIANAG